MKKSNSNESLPRRIFVTMYQRSNVLHERRNDDAPFSVPILIGGRWVRCDRGRRRLFPESSGPETDQVSNLLREESDDCKEKWNFDFIGERPCHNGDWEWIPQEEAGQSDLEQDEENEEVDDDDGDLQEVISGPNDSDDDNEGSPETKRSRMVPVFDITDAH